MTDFERICTVTGVRLDDNRIAQIAPKPFRDIQGYLYDWRKRRRRRNGPSRLSVAEITE
jgi:hypothetical protein